MSKLCVDLENITDLDIEQLLFLIDQMRPRTSVVLLKYSKPKSELINYQEIKRLGLPYSDVRFVDFESYSMRTDDMFDAVLTEGQDTILLTKNWDLAIRLKPQVGGVYIYG